MISLTLVFLYVLTSEKKLISGRYLGEILRLVIVELIDEGVIFLGQNTYKIETPYSLDTASLSLMESYVFRCPAMPKHRLKTI